MRRAAWSTAAAMLAILGTADGQTAPPVKEDGYRGIWYANQPTGDQYGYKYSGGMATYPQQHAPIAIYAPAAEKTFFVYGGAADDDQRLLHMVSYYDHRTGRVPRPTRLLDKNTTDAHDNPTLAMDEEGYLYVFSNAHGPVRPTYIHRSRRPYSIDAFDRLPAPYFSYSQPWHLADGFLLLHTRYESGGRSLHIVTSPDARSWTKPRLFARMREGSYQVSWSNGRRVATAFDLHPDDAREAGLNRRTNLYYAETADEGSTWRTAAGAALDLPLRSAHNPALVHDYQAEQRLVYLKDVTWDQEGDQDGSPVILFLLARDHRPGPVGGPREWQTARWDRRAATWQIQPVTTSDHNYDHGSLYIEPGGRWRLLAPTDPGAYPGGTGGDLVLWESRDRGATWSRIKRLTHGKRNHSYARRPLRAHPQFWALWADGNPLEPSESALYFTDRDATHVWRLPMHMSSETAKPEIVW
ncbi:MAG: hypothetical protein GEV06_15745 [Luteitalea sp.]|nr:hypothetical protein [Luteitalea sp.]